jgi:UDP-2,3-diacylglucosamine hydrolase
MKAIFFSDAHLIHNNAERTERVQAFIREVSKDADMVFILGDLFEFYHGYHGYIYPFFRETVDVLKEITTGKEAVYLIEGNHEFGMGEFFESYTGIRCVKEAIILLDDKKVYLAHGDRLGLFRLGSFLKSRFIYSVMDLLGPDLTWKTAMWFRLFLSKKHKGYNERIRNKYRTLAEVKLKDGYDAVILAHSHISDIVDYNDSGRKKTYLNTGDLIESFSYGAYITGKGFTLHSY